MNFMEAVKAMKEGKKVRRKGWNIDIYLKMDTDDFSGDAGYLMYNIKHKEEEENDDLYFKDFEATDWKIVKEKKTLSDKIVEGIVTFNSDKGLSGFILQQRAVKEAIKEFIDSLVGTESDVIDIKQKAKEIFGERLI